MPIAFETPHITVRHGHVLDELRALPDESVDCVVTSPPYWGLRDYGVAGQIGLEDTPPRYISTMVEVFREVRRLLRPHGTVWLNLGDSYATRGGSPTVGSFDGGVGRGDRPKNAPNRGKRQPRGEGRWGGGDNPAPGLKAKDMVGIPWRVAFALQADGWYLRSDIIWAKPNPMPESVTDRPTKAHEYVFLLAKSERYYYDADAIREAFASSTSDLRKMAEGLDRLGGKHKDADDPLLAASANTNVGRKRSVGNAVAAAAALAGRDRKPSGWNSGPGDHRDLRGRFPGIGPQHAAARNRGEDYADGMAINPGGRNSRSVWTIATQPYPEAHFATFPTELPRRCILAGCPTDGVVLDPFAGSGTTLTVARDLNRRSIGIEINPEYVRLIEKRCAQLAMEMGA